MVVAWILIGRALNPMGLTYEFHHSLEPGCVRKPHKIAEAIDTVSSAVDDHSLLRVEDIEWSWFPYRRTPPR